MTAALERLEWDSAHFGFSIARLVPERCEAFEETVTAARDDAIRCVYLLLDAADAARLDAAQAAGFRVRDVRVELERSLAGAPDRAPDGVRDARPDDVAALERIARERFTDARFFTDGGFPAERAAELYAAWLRRGLDTPERRVLVAGDAEGFLVAHTGTGTVELIAVAAGAEGRGYGAALVAAADAGFVRAGLDRARVVTQARNVGAQRLYQRAGYRTSAVAYWLHWWNV